MKLTATIGHVVDVLDCQIQSGKPGCLSDPDRDRLITAVSSDSRSIQSGSLFVAIKGDSFDGHDFVADAFSRGAAGALVSADWAKASSVDSNKFSTLIVVEDVLASLQDLAIWYRSRLDTAVIGITGSSGKTTTKDMAAAILSTRYTILKTPGNLNSQLGLAQVLFHLDRIHDMAVLEMGMNHSGEIARLAEMARPSVGVITNVGPVHLEHLRSIEGVASAKGELLDDLGESDTAVLNADDPYVMSQRPRTQARLVTFGRNERANVRATEVESTFSGSEFCLDDGTEFQINIPGEHQVMNALAAIAVGQSFDINHSDMQTALAEMTPSVMRMEIRSMGSVTCINDTYNANPISVRAALRTLESYPLPGRRIAVLGDMLELGDSSAQFHHDIGVDAGRTADFLIVVGDRAEDIAEGARSGEITPEAIFVCGNNDEAWIHLCDSIQDGDVVLIKGSRGMHMEELVASMEASIDGTHES